MSALLPVLRHKVVNTISLDMHDIVKRVSHCLRKKDLGGFVNDSLRIFFISEPFLTLN